MNFELTRTVATILPACSSAMSLSDTRIPVRLSSSHHNLTFHWTDKAFYVLHDVRKAEGTAPSSTLRPALTVSCQLEGPRHTRTHDVLHHNLLRVHFDSEANTLTVSYLKPKNKNKHAQLVVLKGVVHDVDPKVVETWAEGVMKALYEDNGVKRCRRLLVFVNPHGGVGKGVKLFKKVVEPVFLASGCDLTVVQTERRGHAFDYVKTLSLDYDAIVTVSGDGLIHEVLNGLAQHEDPIKALNISLAPIPAGSGNGLALNLIGIEHTDTASAALNVIKGRPMKTDLFSITQGGKRSLSFMSQSLGLMADLDLDTEHLRWIGDTRFMYGLLRGIITFNPCPIQLSMKVAGLDKDAMAKAFHDKKLAPQDPKDSIERTNSASGALPSLQYLPDDKEGWIDFEDPILFVYAGQGPYVGRDYMAFPVSLPDDGYIDLSIMPLTTRGEMLSAIDGAETGENFWLSQLQYYKAHAYRVKPLSKKGNFSVDEPKPGMPLGYGHHLAFFHARKAEHQLREDGTDEEISPPAPFLTRMWAGGKITWDIDNPLISGAKTTSSGSVLTALKKGFEKNRPMVFVTQKIEFTMEGKSTPSLVEERQHVYLAEGRVVRKEPRLVPDIPASVDFSFTYKPTPVTLFRFSSLMFNAHHIHLDKDYTTNVEGYPERLVHGPLTAMMLLETLTFNYPMAHIKEFEYRATNPMYVDRELTLNGTWVDETTAKVWCVDDEGVVGMRGTIKTAA
ncbi:hypothetical protein EST38_g4972 [Candolleomyces aberdarensis]|uniref:DAGKc domain-containing protein n=1 Tax=Candolleomyces aberdarensis TaxID=2316362 RepID=A0A4Q2DLP8_9AGAR|nr:hypothetical protein EST38_g4972 [Candolleomyces aberdarensis]